MCLTTNNPDIKIADRDIIVYKHLLVYDRKNKRNWFTRFFKPKFRTLHCSEALNYEYVMGKLNPNEELLVNIRYDADARKSYFIFDKGYHSDVDPKWANTEFIIPKGTKYIEGWYNADVSRKNYISETIIFVGMLKNFGSKN